MWDHPRLQAHLASGGNYGVLTGVGRLIVVDFDDASTYEAVKHKLPETFTVLSANKKLPHLYYLVDEPRAKKILNGKDTLVDIQGPGNNVMGAGSTLENGNTYTIRDDLSITHISMESLEAVFADWTVFSPASPTLQQHAQLHKSPFLRKIQEAIPLSTLLAEAGIDTTKNPTRCPFGHASQGGKCFSFTDEKDGGVYHCFHCLQSGNIFTLTTKLRKQKFPEVVTDLASRAGIARADVTAFLDKLKKGKDTTTKASMHFAEGVLYEEVLLNNTPTFVSLQNDQVVFSEEIDTGLELIYPRDDEEVTDLTVQAVILPRGIQPYDSEERLLEDIRAHIHKYIDVPEDFEIFCANYIMMSWVYDRMNTIPYLSFMGDTGTGKSRCANVTGWLCYKPCKVAGSITPAPIYRMIRKWGGTLIIEESDFKDSSENNEVITILNCGFEKGNPVIRCLKDSPDTLQFFPTFCPKIINRRKSFDDKALESRCLTHITMQTRRKDIPALFPAQFYEEQEALRQQLLMFRLRNYQKITVTEADIDVGLIEPRLKQATLSFAALFANMPRLQAQFRTFLQSLQIRLVNERAESYEGRILNAYAQLLQRGVENITCEKVMAWLIESRDIDKITTQTIAKVLRTFNVVTKNKRADGTVKRVLTIVSTGDFLGACDRYGLSLDEEFYKTLVSSVVETAKKDENVVVLSTVTMHTPLLKTRLQTDEKTPSVDDELSVPIGSLQSTTRLQPFSSGNEGVKITSGLCEFCSRYDVLCDGMCVACRNS